MYTNRVVGAALLDAETYEDIERDTRATGQALVVVLAVGIAAGVGYSLSALLTGHFREVIVQLVGQPILAVIGWLIWSGITFWIGTSFMGGHATYGELLRTIGFAQAPAVLHILNFIPILGPLIGAVASIWVLVAGFIAVRQALDISSGRALGVVLIGWLIATILYAFTRLPL